MLRPLITATVAAVLLAGCNSGDDKSAEQAPADSTPSASATPTTPELATFDPPKAFTAVSALAQSSTDGTNNAFNMRAGMVGPTALYALRRGLTGYTLSENTWEVPSADDPTTTTSDFTEPVPVQLDGKEVIAVAYAQTVQGSGTQKSHGQVKVQWIDPADGKVLVEVVADLSALLGPGNGVHRFSPAAYDAATGQIAVGVDVQSPDRTAKINELSVFADPVTKKATTIPSVTAGGVRDGMVVGAKGDNVEHATNAALVHVDGVTGTVKKTVPVPTANYLFPVGSGGKHGYFVGNGYQKNPGHYVSSIYAVDIATGAVVDNKFPNSEESPEATACFSDHVSSVVCHRATAMSQPVLVTGFDDTTGKKAWGYDATAANRVVPLVTAIYNGVVYGYADQQAVLLDAKTGQDIVAAPSATPSDGSTPGDGESPSDGESPGDSTSPSDIPTSLPSRGGWGDTSLLYGQPKSPDMVSKYGSAYLQDTANNAPTGTEKILVVQKAIG